MKRKGFLPVDARRALARATFPNDLGNYRGKRQEPIAGKPLSPRERFVRLAALFVAARGTYANPPRGSEEAKCVDADRKARAVERRLACKIISGR